jgi:hypothetical protein
MKKINIIYWISTALLLLVMGGGGVAALLSDPKAPQMANNPFHYPVYFMLFISAAKVLGSITLLVPGLPKLKEWVYAGFTFDLIGATYSMIAINMPTANIAIMPVFFLILAVSYIYHRKRLTAKTVVN